MKQLFRVELGWGGGYSDKTTGVKELVMFVEAESQGEAITHATQRAERDLGMGDADKIETRRINAE